jgi:hypothetical protein
MHTINITGAEKITVQADGSQLLSVNFDVVKDGAVVVSYAHGFPLTTSEADLEEYFKNWLATYENNKAIAEKNQANADANAAADATISTVVGKSITN